MIEFVAPSPAVAFAAATPASEHVAPAPAAFATRAEATFEISGADGGGGADLPAEQDGWSDAELSSGMLDGWHGAQVLVQPEAVVPESTDVTEGRGDADMPESMMETSEDAAEPSLPGVGPVAGEAHPDVTEGRGDADMPESMMKREDAAEPSHLEFGPVAGEAQVEHPGVNATMIGS